MNSSTSGLEYPWPNDTTTLENSDSISSKILFDDVDGNSYQDAVFFSTPSDLTKAATQAPVIRMVYSGNFKEIVNVNDPVTTPDFKQGMLLLDVDLDDSEKELVYISKGRSHVVAISLAEADAGQEKFKYPLVEPINDGDVVGFKTRSMAGRKSIEFGSNVVVIDSIVGSWIESYNQKTDGGWSAYYSWTSCSKTCGDGIQSRIRLCTDPVQRNGGALCSSTTNQTRKNRCSNGELSQCGVKAVETMACRLKACQESDCDQYQIFDDINKNCNEDPDNPRPRFRGTDGTAGVVNPYDPDNPFNPTNPVRPGDPFEPGECPAGKVWDPFYFACFTPYPINNIMLTHRTRESRGEDRGQSYYYVDHTHRLGLTHSLASGMSTRATASEYCRFSGHTDVMSFKEGSYTVESSSPTKYKTVFVLCNIATNGLFYAQGGCPVGNYQHSFDYTGTGGNYTHPAGETYKYLKSVVCRKDDAYRGGSSGSSSSSSSSSSSGSVQ